MFLKSYEQSYLLPDPTARLVWFTIKSVFEASDHISNNSWLLIYKV